VARGVPWAHGGSRQELAGCNGGVPLGAVGAVEGAMEGATEGAVEGDVEGATE